MPVGTGKQWLGSSRGRRNIMGKGLLVKWQNSSVCLMGFDLTLPHWIPGFINIAKPWNKGRPVAKCPTLIFLCSRWWVHATTFKLSRTKKLNTASIMLVLAGTPLSACHSTKTFCLNHPLSNNTKVEVKWRLWWTSDLLVYKEREWKGQSVYSSQVSYLKGQGYNVNTDRKRGFKWGRDLKIRRKDPETYHSRLTPRKLQRGPSSLSGSRWHVGAWLMSAGGSTCGRQHFGTPGWSL